MAAVKGIWSNSAPDVAIPRPQVDGVYRVVHDGLDMMVQLITHDTDGTITMRQPDLTAADLPRTVGGKVVLPNGDVVDPDECVLTYGSNLVSATPAMGASAFESWLNNAVQYHTTNALADAGNEYKRGLANGMKYVQAKFSGMSAIYLNPLVPQAAPVTQPAQAVQQKQPQPDVDPASIAIARALRMK